MGRDLPRRRRAAAHRPVADGQGEARASHEVDPDVDDASNGRARRDRPRRDARAQLHDVPRRPPASAAADSPNLAGQYPDVIYKQMLDYKTGARTQRDHGRPLAATSRTRTSPTSPPTTRICRGCPPTTSTPQLPAALVRRRRPDAQHRAVRLLPRRHRPEARQPVAGGHAAGLPRGSNCRPSRRARAATTATPQMRNVARAMTPHEIDEFRAPIMLRSRPKSSRRRIDSYVPARNFDVAQSCRLRQS